MDEHQQPTLAIDIGGTKIAVALVRGSELLVREQIRTPAMAGPTAVVDEAIAMARRVVAAGPEKPIAVGVGCAGVVLYGRVRAMSPELLPGWHDFPLEGTLGRQLGLPVVVVNDAQAAAFGEWRYGAGSGRNSIMFITVSTGVGGGLVLGGQLWSGASGVAGHIGHMHGGKVERLASGSAMTRRASEAGHAGLDARRVIEAAKAGDEWAVNIVHDGVNAIVGALVDVRLLADPGLIVLGGGVGLDPYFRETLVKALELGSTLAALDVTEAVLGADAGLVGAAALAYDAMHTP